MNVVQRANMALIAAFLLLPWLTTCLGDPSNETVADASNSTTANISTSIPVNASAFDDLRTSNDTEPQEYVGLVSVAGNDTDSDVNTTIQTTTSTTTTTQVTSQRVTTCSGKLHFKKDIICYYRGQTPVDKLDPCACTHLILASWSLTDDFQLESQSFKNLSFVQDILSQNPQLRILASIRVDTGTANGTEIMKQLKNAVDPLVDSLTEFLTDHPVLVGVEMDILLKEPEHRDIHVKLLKALRTALDNITTSRNDTGRDHLMLTTTISTVPEDIVQAYDFVNISRYVDVAYIPAYNFTIEDAAIIFHHSRLMGVSDMVNSDSMVDLVVSLGFPLHKLILGIPAFGVAYTLLHPNQTTPFSPATGRIRLLPYRQICPHVKSGSWTIVRDEDQTGVRTFKGTAWIGYDDPLSVRIKSKYVLLRGLAGIGVWSLDDDDPAGQCSSRRFPLVAAARDTLGSLQNANQKTIMDSMEEDLVFSASETTEISVRRRRRRSIFQVTQIIDRNGKIHIVDQNDQTGLQCTRQGYYRHPEFCGRFYRCVKFDQYRDEFTIFEYDCPAGLVFDERYEVCSWPSASLPCDGSSEIFSVPKTKFVCQSVGYFRDPENCRWFYKCSDFYGDGSLTAFEFRCPFDLVFDEQLLLCNWRWLTEPCPGGYGYLSGRSSAGIHHGRSGPYSSAYGPLRGHQPSLSYSNPELPSFYDSQVVPGLSYRPQTYFVPEVGNTGGFRGSSSRASSREGSLQDLSVDGHLQDNHESLRVPYATGQITSAEIDDDERQTIHQITVDRQGTQGARYTGNLGERYAGAQDGRYSGEQRAQDGRHSGEGVQGGRYSGEQGAQGGRHPGEGVQGGRYSGGQGAQGGRYSGEQRAQGGRHSGEGVQGGRYSGDQGAQGGRHSGEGVQGGRHSGEGVQGGRYSGEQGAQGGRHSGEQGVQGGRYSGEQGVQGGRYSGGQGVQGGIYSGDQGVQGGRYSGEQAAQGGRHSGEQGAQGGRYSGEQGAQGGRYSGEQGAQGGRYSGEQGVQGGRYSGGQRAQGGRYSGEQGTQGGRPSGEQEVQGGRYSGDQGAQEGRYTGHSARVDIEESHSGQSQQGGHGTPRFHAGQNVRIYQSSGQDSARHGHPSFGSIYSRTSISPQPPGYGQSTTSHSGQQRFFVSQGEDHSIDRSQIFHGTTPSSLEQRREQSKEYSDGPDSHQSGDQTAYVPLATTVKNLVVSVHDTLFRTTPKPTEPEVETSGPQANVVTTFRTPLKEPTQEDASAQDVYRGSYKFGDFQGGQLESNVDQSGKVSEFRGSYKFGGFQGGHQETGGGFLGGHQETGGGFQNVGFRGTYQSNEGKSSTSGSSRFYHSGNQEAQDPVVTTYRPDVLQSSGDGFGGTFGTTDRPTRVHVSPTESGQTYSGQAQGGTHIFGGSRGVHDSSKVGIGGSQISTYGSRQTQGGIGGILGTTARPAQVHGGSIYGSPEGTTVSTADTSQLQLSRKQGVAHGFDGSRGIQVSPVPNEAPGKLPTYHGAAGVTYVYQEHGSNDAHTTVQEFNGPHGTDNTQVKNHGFGGRNQGENYQSAGVQTGSYQTSGGQSGTYGDQSTDGFSKPQVGTSQFRGVHTSNRGTSGFNAFSSVQTGTTHQSNVQTETHGTSGSGSSSGTQGATYEGNVSQTGSRGTSGIQSNIYGSHQSSGVQGTTYRPTTIQSGTYSSSVVQAGSYTSQGAKEHGAGTTSRPTGPTVQIYQSTAAPKEHQGGFGFTTGVLQSGTGGAVTGDKAFGTNFVQGTPGSTVDTAYKSSYEQTFNYGQQVAQGVTVGHGQQEAQRVTGGQGQHKAQGAAGGHGQQEVQRVTFGHGQQEVQRATFGHGQQEVQRATLGQGQSGDAAYTAVYGQRDGHGATLGYQSASRPSVAHSGAHGSGITVASGGQSGYQTPVLSSTTGYREHHQQHTTLRYSGSTAPPSAINYVPVSSTPSSLEPVPAITIHESSTVASGPVHPTTYRPHSLAAIPANTPEYSRGASVFLQTSDQDNGPDGRGRSNAHQPRGHDHSFTGQQQKYNERIPGQVLFQVPSTTSRPSETAASGKTGFSSGHSGAVYEPGLLTTGAIQSSPESTEYETGTSFFGHFPVHGQDGYSNQSFVGTRVRGGSGQRGPSFVTIPIYQPVTQSPVVSASIKATDDFQGGDPDQYRIEHEKILRLIRIQTPSKQELRLDSVTRDPSKIADAVRYITVVTPATLYDGDTPTTEISPPYSYPTQGDTFSTAYSTGTTTPTTTSDDSQYSSNNPTRPLQGGRTTYFSGQYEGSTFTDPNVGQYRPQGATKTASVGSSQGVAQSHSVDAHPLSNILINVQNSGGRPPVLPKVVLGSVKSSSSKGQVSGTTYGVSGSVRSSSSFSGSSSNWGGYDVYSKQPDSSTINGSGFSKDGDGYGATVSTNRVNQLYTEDGSSGSGITAGTRTSSGQSTNQYHTANDVHRTTGHRVNYNGYDRVVSDSDRLAYLEKTARQSGVSGGHGGVDPGTYGSRQFPDVFIRPDSVGQNYHSYDNGQFRVNFGEHARGRSHSWSGHEHISGPDFTLDGSSSPRTIDFRGSTGQGDDNIIASTQSSNLYTGSTSRSSSSVSRDFTSVEGNLQGNLQKNSARRGGRIGFFSSQADGEHDNRQRSDSSLGGSTNSLDITDQHQGRDGGATFESSTEGTRRGKIRFLDTINTQQNSRGPNGAYRQGGNSRGDSYGGSSSLSNSGGVRQDYVGPIVCERAGLFRHPEDCNKFYECYWDKWIEQFTFHLFDCPVRLIYDNAISGCNWPAFGPTCPAK